MPNNGAPGTPSDDEDLPHPLPGVVTGGPSPTGSLGSQRSWEGGATAYPVPDYRDFSGTEGGTTEGESYSGPQRLQRSLSEGLDAIEAPKGPGDRPLGAASPKLRSSFPTHTRLSAMLHIDSDEEEERSGSTDIYPVPGSPLLLNGGHEEDLFPELQQDSDTEHLQPQPRVEGDEQEGVKGEECATGGESYVAPELDLALDLEDASEPDVFSEVEEVPFFSEVLSQSLLVEVLEGPEEGQGPADDPSSEIDTCSMATAPQTVFSCSESCPITMSTAQVSDWWCSK